MIGSGNKFVVFYGLAVFIVLFAIGYGTGVGGSFMVNLIASAVLGFSAAASFYLIRKYGGPKD
ncbi:MAG: hypothetical protein KC451_03345 [Amylibacter sp.]|jgi:hypothetical protein|nr:hypothetical protein [Amylibacter sp.]